MILVEIIMMLAEFSSRFYHILIRIASLVWVSAPGAALGLDKLRVS